MSNGFSESPEERWDPGEGVDMRATEDLLRRLPLRESSIELDSRVTRLLGRQNLVWGDVVRTAGLGIAAMLFGAIAAAPLWRGGMFAGRRDGVARSDPGARPNEIPAATIHPSTEAAREHPQLVTWTESQTSDDRIIKLAGSAPVERYRRHSVQQVWLVDPRTGGKTLVTIPQDEIVLRKVQSY